MLLGADGHQVTIAHDGDQALSAAVADPPDIVILDIGLPGLDGYGVARLPRTQLAGRVPLIAALSGYGQQSDRKRSEEAGIDVHLVKPTGLGEIYGALAAATISRAGVREP